MTTLLKHLFGLMFLVSTATTQAVPFRVKDIARIAGLESMELVGYGIIIGLNGTGDKDLELTRQTMANLLDHFNIQLNADDIKSKNVAAVALTARAQPFHQQNDRVHVRVSSLGDATSLEGGVLLMSPMLDPSGQVYALAQGSITVGGFSAGAATSGGNTVTRNHTTTGLIMEGATLKFSQEHTFSQGGMIRLILRQPDFTTAERMAVSINRNTPGLAVAHDAATVTVQIPSEEMEIGNAAAFVSRLEQVSVEPDQRARVVINERTGTIVMGGDVHIREAVVAHGNLTVTVKETLHPSHPTNLILQRSGGIGGFGIQSLETPDVVTTIDEEKARIMLVPETTTIRELADILNLMGATPRDLISILQALHHLGALQVEIVSM